MLIRRSKSCRLSNGRTSPSRLQRFCNIGGRHWKRRNLYSAGSGSWPRAIKFRAVVDDIVLNAKSLMPLVPPFSVFGPLKIARTSASICEAIEADDIWNRANTAREVHFAILLKMAEISRAGGNPCTLNNLPTIIVGSDFLSSLRQNQAGPNSMFGSVVLETCARVALGCPKNRIDLFTKAARSQNTEQWKRGRDGALAFRTHVTKGHQALRLVLWQRTDGVFELANLSVHNDLALSEGVAAGAVQTSWC